ncbi:MAG: hypothetical protein EBZ77_06370, partial [Chitinophagia bacterium]|nr:hypothetical protein [Chitinophagia bacterium]
PDYFAKGYEYTAGAINPKTQEEIAVLDSYGGEVIFTYWRSRNSALYALGGLGITTSRIYQQNSDWFYAQGVYNGVNIFGPKEATIWKVAPNVQITPLGFRFGRQLKGFVELGYGYRGILSGGISLHLGRN